MRGRPPLTWAVDPEYCGAGFIYKPREESDLNKVKLLVKAGADVNAVGGETMSTALARAEQYGRRQIVAFLKQCGAVSAVSCS